MLANIVPRMIDLQNYLSKSPDDARARALLALVLVELNDIDRAAVEVRRAKELGAARELDDHPRVPRACREARV